MAESRDTTVDFTGLVEAARQLEADPVAHQEVCLELGDALGDQPYPSPTDPDCGPQLEARLTAEQYLLDHTDPDNMAYLLMCNRLGFGLHQFIKTLHGHAKR